MQQRIKQRELVNEQVIALNFIDSIHSKKYFMAAGKIINLKNTSYLIPFLIIFF